MTDEKPIRIVVFGASITAYRDDLDIFSFQLERTLVQRGLNVQVFNSGVPGNTSADGCERFDVDVLDFHPHVVLMTFGTNDAAIDVWKGVTTPRVSLEKYRENLTYMTRTLNDCGAYALLLTPPPMVWTDRLRELYGKPPYTDKGFNFMLDQYIAAMKTVAEHEHAGLVDINAAFRTHADNDETKLGALFSDGMHPNQAGQNVMTTAILDVLDAHIDWTERQRTVTSDIVGIHLAQPEINRPYNNPAAVLIEFTLPIPFDTLETRFKAHNNVPADRFSAWTDTPFTCEHNVIRAEIAIPSAGTVAVQIRTRIAQAVNALGQATHVILPS